MVVDTLTAPVRVTQPQVDEEPTLYCMLCEQPFPADQLGKAVLLIRESDYSPSPATLTRLLETMDTVDVFGLDERVDLDLQACDPCLRRLRIAVIRLSPSLDHLERERR